MDDSIHAKQFHWPVRVYYEDTDAGGVVYHSNYLKFFERARTEWVRTFGCDLSELAEKEGIQFAVTAVDHLKFIKPARLDQELVIVSSIKSIGAASLIYIQEAYFKDQMDKPICTAEITLVALNDRLRPTRLPKFLLKEFKHAC